MEWRSRKSAGCDCPESHSGEGQRQPHNRDLGRWQANSQLLFIEDCLDGIDLLMNSEIEEPINLGSNELVTINGLVDVVEEIIGVKLRRSYNLQAPKGVNGRNSDNTLIRERFTWEPTTPLRVGMQATCDWISTQISLDAVS